MLTREIREFGGTVSALMPGKDITPEVKRFIQNTINSAEQLEVLLFLMSNPDQDWSADEISRRTRLAVETVAEKLAGFEQTHLVQVRREPTLYRYSPKSSALAEEVAESLNQAYRERRDSVIELIFSRPLENIRIFSDAFRIRRDD